MKVNIKKLRPEAVIPQYAHNSDAGLDLVATSVNYDEFGNTVYGTGIAMEIPEGHVGLLFPRSSNAKKSLALTNCVGVVDSNFRGEILMKYKTIFTKVNALKLFLGMPRFLKFFHMFEYEVGDRIGQLIIMPYPKVEFEEVDFLYPSDRGEGGYGSTGR